ncbi:DUF2971 domain-containing protein [Terrisporobacter petrolearius]|uniref:DUF2971 domain-containing protein n=1 Tax=Terrisporobacter petrolearius TaxID=1460447 RepID=UPI003AFFE154
MNNPEYLYHYTSIETLALILKYKKIRFSRLDHVDDLEEAETCDLGNLGRYCFVSCWTADEQENIPFWGMYTRDMKGVRIKMSSDMFKTYEINPINKIAMFGLVKFSKFKDEEIFKEDTMISYPWDNILKQVIYTDDEEKIYPKIFSINPDKKLPYEFKFGKLGECKRLNWKFQNEWRFRFNILPINIEDANNSDFSKFLVHIKNNKNLDMDYYFLEIDESKLKEMEITMGPNTTDSEKIIVESLVKEFNPTAKIYDSSLKNKVKPK